ACLVALVYTHPLGGLMVIALAGGFAAQRASSRLTGWSWLAIHLIVTVAMLPWVGRYLDHPPDPKRDFPHWVWYFTWPQAFLGGKGTVVWIAYGLIAYGIIRPGAATGDRSKRGWLDRLRRARVDRPVTVVCLLAWLVVPIVLLTLYSR